MPENSKKSSGSLPGHPKRIRVILSIVFCLAPVFSAGALDNDAIVEIQDIVIRIDGGRTKQTALRDFLDVEAGQQFFTEADLVAHLMIQEQDLVNERVFEEVSINFIRSESNSDKVIVTVYVKDSWTLVPIPYISYNSNTGLKIGVETTYDNAFGSMTNWTLDTDITLGPDYYDQYTLKGFTVSPLLTSLKIDNFRFNGGIIMEYGTEVTGVPGNWSEYSSYYQTNIFLARVGNSRMTGTTLLHRNWVFNMDTSGSSLTVSLLKTDIVLSGIMP